MIVQAFYDGVTQSVRSTIDAAIGRTLISKTEDEPCNLVEEMALSNFQRSTERSQPARLGGKPKVDALTLLFSKVDVITQRLDHMNVNAVNSSPPSHVKFVVLLSM